MELFADRASSCAFRTVFTLGLGGGFDGGRHSRQGGLPLLELLPGQKADRLVVGQAVLAGVLRIETVDLPSDRLRRGFVLPEHFPRQVRAAKIGFILARQGAFGPSSHGYSLPSAPPPFTGSPWPFWPLPAPRASPNRPSPYSSIAAFFSASIRSISSSASVTQGWF